MNLSFIESKPDIQKTLSMMQGLYDAADAGEGGHVTLLTLLPSDTGYFGEINLLDYDFARPGDIERYAEDLCGKLDDSFRQRARLDDNRVNSVSPALGIGDYSAFVAGDIDFRADTSWSHPVLSSLDAYRELPPVGTAVWYNRFLAIEEAMLRRYAETGTPFMRGFFSPLDLAAALRGDAIYLDFYDDPEGLHGLLDYCATATIRFAEDIYALARCHLGDTPHGMWMLDGNINMSEDIACMISGDLYREFCAPHTQRVINHFGRGHMHCHSRAMYLVREICSLDHVVNLWLATDPNQPRPIDCIEDLVEMAQGTCLAVDCESFEEIERNFGAMRKGNFSICLPSADEAAAQESLNRFDALCKR